MTYLGLKAGKTYKERRTDTHVYFVGGPFSQWWPSEFTAAVWPSMAERTWTSCEQFMMAGKALLFHDVNTYDKITLVNDPKAIKALGRKVKNFDDLIWRLNAREIVYRGNLAKFSQNEQLNDYMRDVDDRSFVEGAIYDPVWGVKLSWNDPAIENPANWRGTNWLGEVLDRVKAELFSSPILI